MPSSWNFTYEAIWPYVQVILEPFGPVIAVGMGILIASALMGAFLKFTNK